MYFFILSRERKIKQNNVERERVKTILQSTLSDFGKWRFMLQTAHATFIVIFEWGLNKGIDFATQTRCDVMTREDAPIVYILPVMECN